jgi:nitrate/nitrite transporter NarK
MSSTRWGLAVGLVLGFAAAFGGLGALAVVALLGVVGAAVGAVVDGSLDLSTLGGLREREPR